MSGHNADIDAVVAVLADHVRGDWSDRTYSCQGCRQRFEDETQERWESLVTDDELRAYRSELHGFIKPDWSLAEYHAHVADALIAACVIPPAATDGGDA